MSFDDLLNWPLLSSLGFDVLNDITHAHVYDNLSSAWIVDRNDDVSQVTRDQLTGKTVVKKIVDLSGQRIVSFSTSGKHTFALSEGGILYGWGTNKQGELGDKEADRTEPTITKDLSDKKVVKIVCGSQHTVALCDDGEVWTWGLNTSGQCGEMSQTGKFSKPDAMYLRACQAIGACNNSSVALTRSGFVYTWGANASGQLGIGQQGGTFTEIARVEIAARVVQIAVGMAHMLALTEDGSVLAWGKNDHGQIGNNARGTNALRPVFVDEMEFDVPVRFIEVAAHNQRDTSAALSTEGVVYIWGICGPSTGPQDQPIPLKTELRNLSEVFARHGGHGTYKTLVIQPDDVVHDTSNAFDNETTGDCRFLVEEKVIHAQKAVLKNRSEYFHAMFNAEWKESKGDIKIAHHHYPAYKALIKFLYTAKLDAPDDALLELVELAHETMNEKLVTLCVERMRYQLSNENIVDVYTMARKLDMQPLLGYCRQYALIFWRKIVRAQSFLEMKAECVKPFVQFVFEELDTEEEEEEYQEEEGTENEEGTQTEEETTGEA